VDKGRIKNVLFVCSGNSCRSIMAEAYLRKRAAEEGLSIEVRSAGTLGIEGMAPPDETIRMLESEKIDPEGYKSKGLTVDLIEWADVVLVMETMHSNRVALVSPPAVDKVMHLKKFDKRTGDLTVPDPIGKPLDFYKVSFDVIKRSIEGFIEYLKEIETGHKGEK
jgi:protein-tyrosine-phosphatase